VWVREVKMVMELKDGRKTCISILKTVMLVQMQNRENEEKRRLKILEGQSQYSLIYL
jgi:hypothetical protein